MSESRHLDRQIQATQMRLRQLQQQAEVGELQNPLLTEAIAQLSLSLEELQVGTEKLHQQNEALQTANERLVQQVAERTQELTQANRLLQDNVNRLQRLAANVPGMIYQYILRANGSEAFTYVSPRCREIYELEPEELLQDFDQVWAMIHPEDAERVRQVNFNSAQQLLSFDIEFRLLPPSGTLRWVRAISQPEQQPNGDVIWDGFVVDISDRKRAGQKIQEQATLLDIASDAIFACDLDQQILYWNQGAEHLYGWTAMEAIGQQANVLLQEDATKIAEIMQTLLEQGEWRGEIQKVTKAGEIVIVEGRWTLVRDEARQPKAILKVNTDITAKKSLEAQFYQSQRLESVGTLAGGIAHDLNNVLTPILVMSQLIRSQNTPPEPESQEMLQVIEASAKRGANLVKQILMFTRGTDGQRVPTNLNSLLQEVANITQQTFPKSIQIQENIPKQALGQVLADPTHLHQVLMNLCVNARDAMPNGGVLTLALESFYVDELFAKMVLDAQVGNYLLVTVSDTGIGIPPKVRDRIFDPFFTTKPQGEGTGLGLSTVLGIVKNYGGFLQVSSELRKGTQVKVYLPILTESLPDATEQPAELPHGNGELVLIVEDDLTMQRTNQSLLTSYHYRTLVAKDGVEAIARYVKRMAEIKLVLMDIMMPNLDGISTIQALKNINPQVAIIATSGLPTHREAVLAAGARAFLGKPYTVGDLLQALSLISKQE